MIKNSNVDFTFIKYKFLNNWILYTTLKLKFYSTSDLLPSNFPNYHTQISVPS